MRIYFQISERFEPGFRVNWAREFTGSVRIPQLAFRVTTPRPIGPRRTRHDACVAAIKFLRECGVLATDAVHMVVPLHKRLACG
jgi:hypothetical protein